MNSLTYLNCWWGEPLICIESSNQFDELVVIVCICTTPAMDILRCCRMGPPIDSVQLPNISGLTMVYSRYKYHDITIVNEGYFMVYKPPQSWNIFKHRPSWSRIPTDFRVDYGRPNFRSSYPNNLNLLPEMEDATELQSRRIGLVRAVNILGFLKWYPQLDGLQWNILFKWMMTGGTLISGNLHIFLGVSIAGLGWFGLFSQWKINHLGNLYIGHMDAYGLIL